MADSNQTLRLNRINAKGLQVATQLADILAGKDIDLSDLGDVHGIEIGDKKERRLRAFLDQINDARKRLLSAGYGACLSCHTPFSDAALDETPWLARCGDCEAKGAVIS